MPTLPPYSTYRTDTKQMMFPQATSHGNILTFTPPGFKHSLNVKFPDSRLAVCEKCKKNFKTRDMCRVRNTHTAAPWSTAFICITVDESCTDAETGKYVDKPLTVRMVQWQPFCMRKPFDSKTPVCSACKRTNRTRSFCRERHKHRHLPWCTVYVLLSALDQTDPNTIVAGASKTVAAAAAAADDNATNTSSNTGSPTAATAGTADTAIPEGGSAETGEGDGENSTTKVSIKTEEGSFVGSEAGSDPDTEEGDDINDIQDSRTFLAKVSSRATTIHWLNLADYDLTAEQAYAGVSANPHEGMQAAQYPPVAAAGMHHYGHPGTIAPGDPQAQYFHAMGYAAQQHQNALKSHQQYFFQMQQRQQQQYHQPPPGGPYQPPPQWPPPPPHYAMGPGDQHHQYQYAAVVGMPPDQAAAQMKRGPEDGTGGSPPPQHPQHMPMYPQYPQPWAMYYGAGYPPPPHMAPPPPPPEGQHGQQSPPPHHHHQQHQHQQPSPVVDHHGQQQSPPPHGSSHHHGTATLPSNGGTPSKSVDEEDEQKRDEEEEDEEDEEQHENGDSADNDVEVKRQRVV